MTDKPGDVGTAPTVVSGGMRPTTATGDPCIDADEILAMTDGTLPPGRVDAILAHVDRCASCAEVLASLGQLDDAPRALGRYKLGRVLGSGAMGIVYDAWDPQLRRRVALKVVRPERADASARDRMMREARALARVSHPNVVAVYDVTELDGEVCVAAELVDGETLATWQAGKPPAKIADAWLQAARGLAAAHAGGVVHRDVKPANVLVGRDGRVRVGDFGLARLGAERGTGPVRSPSVPPGIELAVGSYPPPSNDDARVTETGYIAGTPAYMAPEQARGDVDARSDQYALGVALAEALTGTRPAAGDQPRVPALPAIEPIIARCVREEPGERYPSMDALVDALATALAPPARHTRIIAATAAGVLAAGAIVVWQVWPRAATCDVPAVPAELWSASRRAEVDKHVPPEIAPRVDRWLASWTAAASATCASEADEVVRARRERCERDQLDELDALLAHWQAQTAPVSPMTAHEAFEKLPLPSECGHAAMATRPDPTPEQLAQVGPLWTRVRHEPATPALYAEARAIGYAPLVVAAAVRLAIATHEAHRDDALATLREAIAIADRSGDALARITARIELIDVLKSDRPDESAAAAETARTLVAQIGAPGLEAQLELHIGEGLSAPKDRGNAIIAYERARRAAVNAFGPDSESEAVLLANLAVNRDASDDKAAKAEFAAAAAIDAKMHYQLPLKGLDRPDVDGQIQMMEKMLATAKREHAGESGEMLSELNLGTAYYIAERYAEALPHYLAGEALADALGAHDKLVVNTYARHANMLKKLGRVSEAVAPARRAVAMAEQLGDDAVLANALTERASATIDADPAAARKDLDRALTAYERAHTPASSRNRARYLFALATWPVDHKRAITLMTSTREEVERALAALPADDPSTPAIKAGQTKRLADIDAWLAAHPK